MDDAGLMERFEVSAHELHMIFERLVQDGYISRTELDSRATLETSSVTVTTHDKKKPGGAVKKKIVIAAEAMEHIRSGISDAGLMREFNISARGLQSLFTKLVAHGYLGEAEIQARLVNRSSTISVEDELAERSDRTDDDTTDSRAYGLHEMGPEALLFAAYGPNGNGKSSLKVNGNGVNRNGDGVFKRERFEIRHRNSGELVYAGDEVSLGALVQKAVSAGTDLSDCDLSGVDLARANLVGARLARADLTKANLVGADLTGAYLAGATMISAELYGATLYKANLADADLSDSNLSKVHAVWSFLKGANLSESNLTRADFAGANLAGAELFQAIFDQTNLTGAHLNGAELRTARVTAAN
jgi:uncharacterized protein YjbI with pentapeptide repeats